MIISRIKFAVPIYTIIIGVSWLLNVLKVVPDVNWVWTAGLAALGVLILVVWSINKISVIIGPFLLIASICSLLKQIGRLEAAKEVPILTIALGCLVLLSQLLKYTSNDIMDYTRENDE